MAVTVLEASPDSCSDRKKEMARLTVISCGFSLRMKVVSFLKAESYCRMVDSVSFASVKSTLIGSIWKRLLAANFRKSIKLRRSLARMKLIQSWFGPPALGTVLEAGEGGFGVPGGEDTNCSSANSGLLEPPCL